MSPDMLLIIKLSVLFGAMLFFLFLKVPIFLSLAGASIAYALVFPGSVPLSVFSQSLAQGIGKETYICIIFYFLLGEVMNCGGITTRIVDLGRAAIGWIPGYLSHINVIASVIFAGVSGSANADTAAIGSHDEGGGIPCRLCSGSNGDVLCDRTDHSAVQRPCYAGCIHELLCKKAAYGRSSSRTYDGSG